MSSMDKIKYLLSSCIPKENREIMNEEENGAECITNFFNLRTLTEANDLTNLDYIMFKSVEYFAQVDGVLNKALFFEFMQYNIDTFMKDKNVKINEILHNDTHQYNLDLEGDFETAKKDMMFALSAYYDDLQEIDTSTHLFNSMLQLHAKELYDLNYRELQRQVAIISSKGMDIWVNGKMERLLGPEDAHQYYLTQYALIENKFKIKEEEFIDTSGDISQLDKADKFQEAMFDVISDTGIKPIDDALKGFRRTQLLGVEAGAGAGKTRFSRWIGYRAITKYKKNVFDVTMEQQYTEIWALYESTHLFVKYGVYIPDSDIKRKLIPEELKHIYQIARHDLFKNPDYGRLRIVAKDMYIEETFEYLIGVKRSIFDYDMLILDYASLVDTKAQKKYGASDAHSIVTEVYKKTKRDICRGQKVFGLIINQLKEAGVKALAKGEMTTTYDASNSGETYKSTDANLVLSSTQQLEREGKIRITSPKFRDAEKFYNVYASAKMGCSFFTYNENEAISEDEYKEQLESLIEKEEQTA